VRGCINNTPQQDALLDKLEQIDMELADALREDKRITKQIAVLREQRMDCQQQLARLGEVKR